MPQNESDFEEEFERALSAYADPGDAGYPPVLTTRVMAAIDARQRKRRWWLGISIAVPALVCLLVVALLHGRRPEPRHQAVEIASVPAITHSAPAFPKADVTTKPRVAVVRRDIVRDGPRQLPKLDQFPTPSPLTEQERLMVQLVARTPPSTQQSIAKAQKQPDAPLHIAELSIPYLDSSTQPK